MVPYTIQVKASRPMRRLAAINRQAENDLWIGPTDTQEEATSG